MRMKKFAAVALFAVPALALAGCSKPAESELHDVIVQEVTSELGATDEVAQAFADCAAPKLHEELGASSLETIIEDGLMGALIEEDDADAGDAILESCITEAGLA